MMLEARQITLGDRLRDVSVAMRAGQVTAICGPNGAGKSSLLATLAGLLEADNGTVLLEERSLATIPPVERARLLGYLPQAQEVAWDVSVETLVSLGRIPWAGAPGTGAQAAIDDAIALMDLEAFRHRPVSRLSGGERARALMARVLATGPRWILADEPLANLDLAHASALVGRFRQQAGAGMGVVLVLHDLAAAMNHADRVLVLDRGRLVAAGDPEDTLSEDLIEGVWGQRVRWLGERGCRALAIG